MSPVQYWFILRHANVFTHRKVARCHTWLNGWLKGWLKVLAKPLHFKWNRKTAEEVLGGKTCEFDLRNFNANAKSKAHCTKF